MHSRPFFIVVAIVTSLAGCYRYSEVPIGDLTTGMSVRLRLTGAGVDRLGGNDSNQARLVNGQTVSGTVARASAESLVVAVPVSVMEANIRQRTALQDFALLRSDVREARLRQFDRTRTTWTVVALGAAVVASVGLALQRGGRAGGTIPPPPPPPDHRFPLQIRWHFR
jgi:hypothetical protein